MILQKHDSLLNLVILFLTLTPSLIHTAFGSQFKFENRPENLKALFETIHHSIYVKKNSKLALSLLVSLFPNEERAKKALRNETPYEALQRILDMYKHIASPSEADLYKLAKPEQKVVRVHGATTEEIAKYAEGSVAFNEFPGGSRRVAERLLRPGMTFYEVEFLEPGKEYGMQYHLFYWDGEQWAMLGPIWRAVQGER